MAKARRIRDMDRQQMVHDLLVHLFNPQVLKLRADYAELALRVYRDHYDELTRKKMAALPKGWLPTNNDIQVKMGDDIVNLYFGGGFFIHSSRDDLYHVLSKDDQPGSVNLLFLSEDHHRCCHVYDVGHTFQREYEGLQQHRAQIIEQISERRARARSVLRGFTTFEKLRAEWPEIAPFIPMKEEKVANLPALPVSELNKLFDLPADKKAA